MHDKLDIAVPCVADRTNIKIKDENEMDNVRLDSHAPQVFC